MKIVITGKDVIKSKKGAEYVKLSYLSPKGQAGEIFTTKEKYDAFAMDESKISTSETLKKMVEMNDLVDAEFDPKGYLVGLE